MYKVILPGEALIDEFKHDNVIKKAGGAPANVAAAISKLGIEASFIGTVGNDWNGIFLKKTLSENGVSIKGLILIDQPTTVAYVSIDSEGERSFSFVRGADELLEYNLIPKTLTKDYDILHLGSATAMLGGPLWDSYLKLLEISQEKIVIFDPNYREALYHSKKEDFVKKSKRIISKSDIVKLSIEELNIISSEPNYVNGAKKLLKLGPKIILITLGSLGTYVLTSNFEYTVPSVKIKQADSTGAGDAFIGYFIGQIAKHELSKNDLTSKKILKFVRKANVCASIVVNRIGALESIPNEKEISNLITENPWTY